MSSFQSHLGHRLTDNQVSLLNKLLVIGFGVVATVLAFLASAMGGIIQVHCGSC